MVGLIVSTLSLNSLLRSRWLKFLLSTTGGGLTFGMVGARSKRGPVSFVIVFRYHEANYT